MGRGGEGAWTVPWPDMAARPGRKGRYGAGSLGGLSWAGKGERLVYLVVWFCLGLSDFDWDVLSWRGEVSVPPTVPSVDSACRGEICLTSGTVAVEVWLLDVG